MGIRTKGRKAAEDRRTQGNKIAEAHHVRQRRRRMQPPCGALPQPAQTHGQGGHPRNGCREASDAWAWLTLLPELL